MVPHIVCPKRVGYTALTAAQARRLFSDRSVRQRDVCCLACYEVPQQQSSYRDLLFLVRRNDWAGAHEALTLLKKVTTSVTPGNEDARTALRSLAGAIGSQANALPTASLVEALSLLGTWRLLSDKTALSLVVALSEQMKEEMVDEASISSCSAALVQLRSNFEGTDAHKVACTSSSPAADAGTSFMFTGSAATDTPSQVDVAGLPQAARAVPAKLQAAAQQVCSHMTDAVRSLPTASTKTVARVMWCCCHWGLRPHELLKVSDESQLSLEVVSLDSRELTAAAWTCGVLQDSSQQHLLESVAAEASTRMSVTGTDQTLSLNQCATIAWSLGRCNSRNNPFWVRLSRHFPVLFSDSMKAPSSIVVRLLWGMAAAHVRHVPALREVVTWLDSGRRLRLCSPAELSHIIWAFSAVHYSPGHGVLQQLSILLAKAVENGTIHCGDAMVSAAALEKFDSLPSQLLTDLAELSVQQIDSCSTAQIVEFLCLLAGRNIQSDFIEYSHQAVASADPFFSAAASVIADRVQDVRPEQMLKIITAFQRISMPLKELLPAASSFTQQHIFSLKPQRVAGFLGALAHEGCDVSSIHEALVQSIIHHLPNIPMRRVSDVAWACATLQLPSKELLVALEARAVADAAQHNSSIICTLIWAFAKLGWCCDEYVSAAGPRLSTFLNLPTVMQPRDVALLLWSFAEMKKKPSKKMVSKLHKAAIGLLPLQDSQSLSLTMVAFRKLDIRPMQLVDALPNLSQTQISSFEPLHIANLLFSLADMRFSPTPEFLKSMIATAEVQADLFQVEEWANITWALAKFCGSKSEPLRSAARRAIQCLAPHILPSVDSCSGSDCSRLLWAYRRADVPSDRVQELVFALLGRCARILPDLSARDISSILWAAGHFRSLDAFPMASMHDVAQALEGRTSGLSISGLTACLTGLACLRLRPEVLMPELDCASAETIREGKCMLSEAALLVSAFAQLGYEAPECCQALRGRDEHFAVQKKLDAHSRIKLLWAMWALPNHSHTALRTAQEQALYKLASDHGLSDDALVKLFQVRHAANHTVSAQISGFACTCKIFLTVAHCADNGGFSNTAMQVCSLQYGQQGKTFLPRRCTVFRRSVVAFEKILQKARGERSDTCSDNNLMVASREILVEASRILGKCGVAHKVVQPHDASHQSQIALPHLLCSNELPNFLREQLVSIQDLPLTCEGGMPSTSSTSAPTVGKATRPQFRIVVIPNDWYVEAKPSIKGSEAVQHSCLTGFAKLELMRLRRSSPDALLVRSSWLASL